MSPINHTPEALKKQQEQKMKAHITVEAAI